MASASWKLCSISGAHTPSASPPDTLIQNIVDINRYIDIDIHLFVIIELAGVILGDLLAELTGQPGQPDGVAAVHCVAGAWI